LLEERSQGAFGEDKVDESAVLGTSNISLSNSHRNRCCCRPYNHQLPPRSLTFNFNQPSPIIPWVPKRTSIPLPHCIVAIHLSIKAVAGDLSPTSSPMAFEVYRVEFVRLIDPPHMSLVVTRGKNIEGTMLHVTDAPMASSASTICMRFQEKPLTMSDSESRLPHKDVFLGYLAADKLPNLRQICMNIPAPVRPRRQGGSQEPNCVTWCNSAIEQVSHLLQE